MAVKVDGVTTMYVRKKKHPFDFGAYFPRAFARKFEQKFSVDEKGKKYQKVIYEHSWIQVQWRWMLKDFKSLFSINYNLARLAYAVGMVLIALKFKDHGLGLLFMGAVGFDNESDTFNNTANSNTITLSTHSVAGANRVAYVNIEVDSDAAPSVTYAGSAMTNMVNQANGANGIWVFRTIAPATGSSSVVLSKTASWGGIQCVTFTGVDQKVPNGHWKTAAATGTAPSLAVGHCTLNDMAYDVIFDSNPATVTAGAGQTKLAGPNFNPGTVDASYEIPSSAGEVTMSWTLDPSAAYIHIAFPIFAVGLFSDAFDRADSTTIGNGWTEVATAGADLAQIISNKLRLRNDAGNNRDVGVYRSQTRGNDLIIFGRYKITTDNTGIIFEVCVNGVADETRNNSVAMQIRRSDNTVHVMDGGTSKGNAASGLNATDEFYYEIQITTGYAIDVRIWATTGSRPSAATLSIAGFTPATNNSNWKFTHTTGGTSAAAVDFAEIYFGNLSQVIDFDHTPLHKNRLVPNIFYEKIKVIRF